MSLSQSVQGLTQMFGETPRNGAIVGSDRAADGERDDASSDSGASAPFELAFDRCADGLYRFLAVRIGGDAHLADDLMQQLWMNARPRAATIAADEIEFYLRGVAANLIRQHWRVSSSRPAHLPIADPALAAELARRLTVEELPADVLDRREVRDQLRLAITGLCSDEQALIIDHYFHGHSHAVLALTRGLSERAVEGRLYRARQALRATLEHLET